MQGTSSHASEIQAGDLDQDEASDHEGSYAHVSQPASLQSFDLQPSRPSSPASFQVVQGHEDPSVWTAPAVSCFHPHHCQLRVPLCRIEHTGSLVFKVGSHMIQQVGFPPCSTAPILSRVAVPFRLACHPSQKDNVLIMSVSCCEHRDKTRLGLARAALRALFWSIHLRWN